MALITIYQYRVVTRSLLIFSGALGDIERVREGAARVCLVTTKFPNFPSHPSHLLSHRNIKYSK